MGEPPLKPRKTILITGAGGFIGSHLCEKYLKADYNVVAVDNFCTGQISNKEFLESLLEATAQLKFFEEDVILPWTWLKQIPVIWLENLKYIFHFASPASPPQFQKLSIETIWANTIGLEKCILTADQYRAKVIFASTSEIYGDPLVHPQPESYWGNVNSVGLRSCYNEAKRLGETLISSYNRINNSNHGIVRIFNTYGPRMDLDDGRVIINFCREALNDGRVQIYGEGQQTRSFCYIDDLVRGIGQYADKDLREPINLGSDDEITVLELAKKIGRILNQKIDLDRKELPLDDPKRRRPDLSKAKALLDGWHSEVTLDEGLLRMIAWLKELR